MKNKLDLVGEEIEVFIDGNVDDIKTVKVKNQKYVGDTLIVTTEDGEIYSDEDINFHYSLTPEAVIWQTLIDCGVIEDDFDSFNYDTYHNVFEMMMERFVGIGILGKPDPDDYTDLDGNISNVADKED